MKLTEREQHLMQEVIANNMEEVTKDIEKYRERGLRCGVVMAPTLVVFGRDDEHIGMVNTYEILRAYNSLVGTE